MVSSNQTPVTNTGISSRNIGTLGNVVHKEALLTLLNLVLVFEI